MANGVIPGLLCQCVELEDASKAPVVSEHGAAGDDGAHGGEVPLRHGLHRQIEVVQEQRRFSLPQF